MERATQLSLVFIFLCFRGQLLIAKPLIWGSESPPPCWTSIGVPPAGHLTSCYDGWTCRCSNKSSTADCSSNEGGLTFVPYLPGEFRIFNFSHNKLTEISEENFFMNVSSSLRILDLYNNGLTYIFHGVFARFTQLELLLLGGNQLKWVDIAAVLAIPSLLDLDVKCNGLGPISRDAFAGVINRSHLRALDLSINHISPLDIKELQPLRRLQHLYIWSNEVSDIRPAYLPSLVAFKLKGNRLFHFLSTCEVGGENSLFPALKNLQFEFNFVSNLEEPVCLPNLTVFTLRYNKIMYFTAGMFSTSRLPALGHLSVAFSGARIHSIEGFTFNNSAMTKLDFAKNKVNFSDVSLVDEDVFGGCMNLVDLILTENNFGTVSVQRFQRLFRPISSSLETLHLGKCGIKHVNRQFFADLHRLKYLYLYENDLTHLSDGVFDSLKNLRLLDLESNRIAMISSDTFSSNTRHRVKRINLSGNLFECTCHLLWFQQWLSSDLHRFVGGRKGYRCANLHNIEILDFQTSKQACLLGPDAAQFTIALTCLILSFFLAFVVFFRFRWSMRLWLYEACRGRGQGRDRRQALGDGRRRYKYDVFVSYAAEDLQWIQTELLPVLEDQWGLRLCVHQRDFELGKHIVDNISDSVKASDRVLLVFSPHFARSQWCQFELKYCQGCVMERDDVMVLVSLQGTESRDMTGVMMAVLKTTTYIEWSDEQEARASFWERLRLALIE